MDDDYVNGDDFHNHIRKVYRGPLEWAVNKKQQFMARVVYNPVHENQQYEDERRGRGKDFATWIFSEEPGTGEGLFETGFELMIDARLDPNASIGLHPHHHTEEIYYILEGSVRMTTLNAEGTALHSDLSAGDAHMVRIGQSHYGTAGPQGVRFLAVAMRRK